MILSFSEWCYENNIEEKYKQFHDEYGDAACSLNEYKERHYNEYLKQFNNKSEWKKPL